MNGKANQWNIFRLWLDLCSLLISQHWYYFREYIYHSNISLIKERSWIESKKQKEHSEKEAYHNEKKQKGHNEVEEWSELKTRTPQICWMKIGILIETLEISVRSVL